MAKIPKANEIVSKGGRPSLYTPELATRICALIAEGNSLRAIAEMPGIPGKRTILEWLVSDKHPEFAHQYARARELQAEGAADEMIEISDTPLLGVVETIKPDGSVEVRKEDMLGHRKLQIDTRKWMLSKLLPKKYGDKLTQELTGKDGGPIASVMMPTRIEFEIIDHTANSDPASLPPPAGEGEV